MRGKFKEYAHLNKMCDVRVYVKHMCIHVLLPESTFQRAFWRWRHPRRKNPILFCFPSLIYCYQYSFVQGDDILASKIPFYLIVSPLIITFSWTHTHSLFKNEIIFARRILLSFLWQYTLMNENRMAKTHRMPYFSGFFLRSQPPLIICLFCVENLQR